MDFSEAVVGRSDEQRSPRSGSWCLFSRSPVRHRKEGSGHVYARGGVLMGDRVLSCLIFKDAKFNIESVSITALRR